MPDTRCNASAILGSGKRPMASAERMLTVLSACRCWLSARAVLSTIDAPSTTMSPALPRGTVMSITVFALDRLTVFATDGRPRYSTRTVTAPLAGAGIANSP